MHALLEDVLPFIAVFYFAESLAFVRAGEWLFVSSWPGRFALRGEGLHLAALAPWSILFSSFQPNIRWQLDGVVVGAEEALIPCSAMESLGVDRHRVLLTRELSLATPSPFAAVALRNRLEAFRDAPPVRREQVFTEQCRAAYDLSAARARLARLEPWFKRLRLVQIGLFVGVFGVVPLELYGRSLLPLPPAAVLGVLFLPFCAALALGYKLLRSCGGSASAAAQALPSLFLFPPGCLHLSALLARPLLADFAPLTLAAALGSADDFRRLARQSLRTLGSRASDPFAVRELDALKHLVEARGLSIVEVLRAPAATDPTAVSYCPFCSQEYRPGFGSCAECLVSLEPLAASERQR